MVDIVTSIVNVNQSMEMYPNPAGDFVTIRLNEAFGWKLFDTTGRLVSVGFSATGNESIDVSKLESGLYTVTFDQPTLKAVKLVVAH